MVGGVALKEINRRLSSLSSAPKRRCLHSVRCVSAPRRRLHSQTCAIGVNSSSLHIAGVVDNAVPRSPLSRHFAFRSNSHRSLHQHRPALSQAAEQSSSDAPSSGSEPAIRSSPGIRARLAEWNLKNGATNPFYEDFQQGLLSESRPSDVIFEQPTESESDLNYDELASYDGSEGPPDSAIETEGMEGLVVQRGDFVEVAVSQDAYMTGIVVHKFLVDIIVYLRDGKWLQCRKREIKYHVPNFVNPQLVEPILPYLPSEPANDTEILNARTHSITAPREVSSSLLAHLSSFAQEADIIYRRHSAILDQASQILAKDTHIKMATLVQITQDLLGDQESEDGMPSEAALFAVRRVLSQDSVAFGREISRVRLAREIVFRIRPKAQVQLVNRVVEVLRKYQDSQMTGQNSKFPSKTDNKAFDVFISKARQLIKDSRENRQMHKGGFIGTLRPNVPLSSKPIALTSVGRFSSQEVDIIQCLLGWCVTREFARTPIFDALMPAILKATGMYEGYDLDVATGHAFLQEIGIITPWENRMRSDINTLLPSAGLSKPLLDLSVIVSNPSLYSQLSDSMELFRKDWGDLPVFCVDNADAQEIDDGISFEPAGQSGKDAWVHVHIAHPSAFINKNSLLSTLAAQMGATVYCCDRPEFMLPKWFTKNYASLDKDRPALTFSMRLDDRANLLETKLTPSYIRNVIKLSAGQISRALNPEMKPPRSISLVVGGRLPTAQGVDHGEIDPKHLVILKELNDFVQMRRRQRGLQGIFSRQYQPPEVEIWETTTRPGLRTPPLGHGRYMSFASQGDPLIHASCTPLDEDMFRLMTTEDDYSATIEECMLLANAGAAEWASARNLPILYRGSFQSPRAKEAEVFLQEKVLPAQNARGAVPMDIAMQYYRMQGPGILSTDSVPHTQLGLQQYTRITSPLRRYIDLVSLWQIDAAIRHEMESGKSLVGHNDHRFLPFSKEELDQSHRRLLKREQLMRDVGNKSDEHWVALLLHRAWNLGELPLPKTMRVLVLVSPASTLNSFVTGIVEDFALFVIIVDPNSCGLSRAEVGDWWECRWHEIQPYRRRLIVAPIRLLSRLER